MMTLIYDTLKISKAPQVSFTPEQSDTLAAALNQGASDSLVTKADLKDAIASVRLDLGTMKSELGSLKSELGSLKSELGSFKADMVRWIVGAIAFNLLGTITIMIAVAKLVK